MQVVNTNLYDIIDQNEERKESLWAAWERDEGLENLLRLAIQEVEAQKVKHILSDGASRWIYRTPRTAFSGKRVR